MIIQTKSKLTLVHTVSKQNLTTERSLPSDNRNLNNTQVAPWSGDQYYYRIKQLIKTNNQRKRSETSNAIKSKLSLTKDKIYVPKIKNMELQVMTDNFTNQWSRSVPKKSSTKLLLKNASIVEKVIDIQKSNKKCVAVHLNQETNPIHFRKSSLRQLPQSRLKTQKNQGQQYDRIKKWQEQKYKLNKGRDKQSRIFFFEAKNSSNIGNRQKMIMKIRNIQKGRVQRAYTQAY